MKARSASSDGWIALCSEGLEGMRGFSWKSAQLEKRRTMLHTPKRVRACGVLRVPLRVLELPCCCLGRLWGEFPAVTLLFSMLGFVGQIIQRAKVAFALW
jgi:hypothetical protein